MHVFIRDKGRIRCREDPLPGKGFGRPRSFACSCTRHEYARVSLGPVLFVKEPQLLHLGRELRGGTRRGYQQATHHELKAL
jgi:hypothetical protein